MIRQVPPSVTGLEARGVSTRPTLCRQWREFDVSKLEYFAEPPTTPLTTSIIQHSTGTLPKGCRGQLPVHGHNIPVGWGRLRRGELAATPTALYFGIVERLLFHRALPPLFSSPSLPSACSLGGDDDKRRSVPSGRR